MIRNDHIPPQMTTASTNTQHLQQSDNIGAKQNKAARTGWASLPSTSVFRAVNFELFVKPNKFVMACGVLAFTSCVSYIVYMNLTDDKKKNTYVTLDEDGGTTVRPKVSRWN